MIHYKHEEFHAETSFSLKGDKLSIFGKNKIQNKIYVHDPSLFSLHLRKG